MKFQPISTGSKVVFLALTGVGLIASSNALAAGIPEDDKKLFEYLVPAESFANSAPAYLGVSADSVRTIDTLKDIGVALSNATQGGTGMVFQVAPVRLRNFVSADDYIGKNRSVLATQWSRALVNTSFLYGQGRTELDGKNFDRQVVGGEVSFFFDQESDPLFRLFNRHYDCAMKNTEGLKDGGAPAGVNVVEKNSAAERAERIKRCVENASQQPSWAQNRGYLSATTGWIKPTEAGVDKQRLGSSFGMGLSYVFGKPQNPTPSEEPMLILLSVNFKRGVNELALDKFSAGAVERKDSNLWSARLTGGYDKVRLLGEVSNASEKAVTSGTRVFRQALGVDYRLTDGIWLTFRTGRMNKVTGDGQETVSSMSLSFSPTKN